MSWIAAAVTVGVGSAIYSGVHANQVKQQNKGYISDAYRVAKQAQNTSQGLARQNTAESLNARGLATPGAVSPIATAMNADGVMKATGPAPTTLGGQVQSDQEVQMGLERRDLENQNTRANQDNKDQYANALIGSVATGLQTGASVYSGGTALSASRAMASAAPMADAKPYMSGIDDPANTFGGIHPVDPLNKPGSSWNRSGTYNGAGGSNSGFNVSNV